MRHYLPVIIGHLLIIGFGNRRRGSRCSILFYDRYSSQCPDGDKVGVGVFIVIIAGNASTSDAVDAAAERLLTLTQILTLIVAIVALKGGGIVGATV